jgi:hypothetical protein
LLLVRAYSELIVEDEKMKEARNETLERATTEAINSLFPIFKMAEIYKKILKSSFFLLLIAAVCVLANHLWITRENYRRKS